jgi:hypothetical protein
LIRLTPVKFKVGFSIFLNIAIAKMMFRIFLISYCNHFANMV